jgi:predicted methyltransferase
MALVIRGMHGWQRNRAVLAWLSEIHEALKPKGVLGIVQHRAKPDANPDESAEHGYLPEAWVIAQVEAAGFKLSRKSEINRNEKDSTDHPEGVWTLPPSLRLGETDKEKYVAIGESDRMTLRFVKVERPEAAKPKEAK